MKSVLKGSALAITLALGLGFHAASQAGSIGTSLTGTTTINAVTANGSFEDLYNFSVSANAGTILSSTSVTLSTYGAVVESIAVYSGTYTTASSLASATPVAVTSSATSTDLGGGVLSYTLSASSLKLIADHPYTLVIEGTSKGISGYTAIVAVSPVPEPATYALLISGLGMVGFMVNRRQKRRG
jgi:hypothetical protein